MRATVKRTEICRLQLNETDLRHLNLLSIMTDAKKRLVIGVLLPSCPILSKQTSSLDVHRFSGVLYLQDLRETSDPQHSLASSSS